MNINSKSFTITDAMKNAIEEQFAFLTEEEVSHTKLKLEQLNPHTLRMKIIYQQPRQKTQTIEISAKDFYLGLEGLAKKFKQQLFKQEHKKRDRCHKKGLAQTFEDALAYQVDEDDCLVNPIPLTASKEAAEIAKELAVPIYQMTCEEATAQLIGFDYTVLMYRDPEENCICTLVRQPDGGIKRYIGIPS